MYMYCVVLPRGDFQVMCGITKGVESVSMFWFMERACLGLWKVSFRLHNQSIDDSRHQDQRPLHPNFCYKSMMRRKFS